MATLQTRNPKSYNLNVVQTVTRLSLHCGGILKAKFSFACRAIQLGVLHSAVFKYKYDTNTNVEGHVYLCMKTQLLCILTHF